MDFRLLFVHNLVAGKWNECAVVYVLGIDKLWPLDAAYLAPPFRSSVIDILASIWTYSINHPTPSSAGLSIRSSYRHSPRSTPCGLVRVSSHVALYMSPYVLLCCVVTL